MAETSAPWATPSANMGEDGWRDYFTGALGEGGVVNDFNAQSLRVLGGGTTTQITVAPGQAIVQGVLYTNNANLTLDVATVGTTPASGQQRADLVVLRYDPTLKTVRAAVKAGSPTSGSTAAEPTLTRDPAGIWETRLAVIRRTGNVPVTQAMITSQRAWLAPTAHSPDRAPDLSSWPYGTRLITPAGELLRGASSWTNLDQPVWSDLTLVGSLQQYTATPQYRVVRGEVQLRGGIQHATVGQQIVSANQPKTLFILPAGARPGRTLRFPLATTFSGDASTARLTIEDTGRAEMVPPVDGTTWVHVDGISFQAEN